MCCLFLITGIVFTLLLRRATVEILEIPMLCNQTVIDHTLFDRNTTIALIVQ